MKNWVHQNYLYLLLIITLISALVIAINGFSYYKLPLDERPFSEKHETLKPSGKTGHALGITGTAMVIIGVLTYSSRKRIRKLSKLGDIRDWLNFHIFLCLTGPTLILFHTTFKFSGIAGVSLWSMLSVVASGIIGRYIYIQIPRGLQGQELTVAELENMRNQIQNEIMKTFPEIEPETIAKINQVLSFSAPNVTSPARVVLALVADDLFMRRKKFKKATKILKQSKLPPREIRKIIKLEKRRYMLLRRITLLDTLKKMFKYWHVVHLPFTIIMFVLMIVHVVVVILLGYKWIF